MITIETDKGQGGWFVRYWSDDPKAVVERFVEEKGITVDWERAFISSTGSINRRRVAQWRLPVVDPGENEWAYAVLREASQRLGLEPPASSDDLDSWAEADPVRVAALEAARAPCRNSEGRPCGAILIDDYNQPFPRVWDSVEEHAGALVAMLRARQG